MKRIVLTRRHHTVDATYGDLHVYDTEAFQRRHLFYCKILELPWRGNKRRMSRVPSGTYPLVLEYSPRFNMNLWELKAVPNRSECKFHSANFVSQLNGCMAFARKFTDINHDGIDDATHSVATMNSFHEVMGSSMNALITIIDIF